MNTCAGIVAACATGIVWFALPVGCLAADLVFTPVQPDLFADPGGQSNAWGDFANAGDLDLALAAHAGWQTFYGESWRLNSVVYALGNDYGDLN